MAYVEAVVRIPVIVDNDKFLVRIGDKQMVFKVVEPYISLGGEYMKDWKSDLNEVPDDVLKDFLNELFDGDVEVVEILGVKG